MNTIQELKNHLGNCNKIMDKFIKKHNIILAYLVVNDSVSINSHSRLNLKVNSEFNNYKVSEVNKILSDLYEEFRKYLEKNKIPYVLHINSEYMSWAVSKIIFKFEITN